jgi:DDE superfamily endonuclease
VLESWTACYEVGHVDFLGNYRAYSINVQAACVRQYCSIEVSEASPGGDNNIAAYRMSNLPYQSNNIPTGYYVKRDNAYNCTEHMLTPFPGDNRNEITKSHI